MISSDLLLSPTLWLAIFSGLGITLLLTAIAISFGLIFGTVLAIARTFGTPVTKALAGAYVFVFRGVPLLILLYFLYFGLPMIGVVRHGILWDPLFKSAFAMAAVGFTLNSSAYLCEVVRGGIKTVKKGEIEAAVAIGFSRATLYRRVVLPIAFRNTIMTIGNEIVFTIKATAIASIITVRDLLGRASEIGKLELDVFTPYVAAAIAYFVLIRLIDAVVGILDRRYNMSRLSRPGTTSTVAPASALSGTGSSVPLQGDRATRDEAPLLSHITK